MKPLPAAPESPRPSIPFLATSSQLAAHTNPWAIGTATIVNGSLLALLLLIRVTTTPHSFPPPPHGSHIDLSDYRLFTPPSAGRNGGSGGSNDLIDPIEGRNPDRSNQPLIPPQVPILTNPTLAINPSIAVPLDIKLPDNPNMPTIGIHSSPNVTLVSNGQGNCCGIGTNGGNGDGPGHGPGWGPGDGIGIPGVNGVSNPIPIVTPEAEFSDEARREKFQGICTISLVVDAQGNPQAPRILQRLGMGLDEKALEAVRRYKFKPALKNGKPVPVRITVAVNFRLF